MATEVQILVGKGGTLPVAATPHSAGFDLCATVPVRVEPGCRDVVMTNLRVSIPEGHVGLVCSRSGLALRHGLFVLNAPGVIDPDYRGPVGVILANFGRHAVDLNPGDRVAQLLVLPLSSARLVLVDELDDTVRGDGGFGSTGVA